MGVGMAILVEVGVILGMGVGDMIMPGLSIVILIGTAIWASIDASNLEFKKYKLNGITGPVIALIGCLLLHIVAFPWHLVNRGKVLRGEAAVKDGESVAKAAVAGVKDAAPQEDPYKKLEKLAELRDKGVISEEEFASQKASILG
jgi:hypothetical protein